MGRKQGKLEREQGPLRFLFDTSDGDLLDILMRWKSAQYRRTGRLDRFARPATVRLVRDLLQTRAPVCSGTLSVLYAGRRPVAIHLGLRSASTLACWFPTYDVTLARYSPGRTGRPCLFVPSGRLALYLALRTWLSPGERLLMSPVNDDVILFVVLAAGLRPVMAPVSAADGNIDPAAVPDTTWSGLGGVLTTNLYGLPDRVEELGERCCRLGIPLIEDTAHAIETEAGGRPIGAFGAAAAFSLSKHAGASGGGVLAFADPRRRPRLEALRDQLLRPRRWQGVADLGRPAAERLVSRARLVRPAHYLRRSLGLAERSAYRMPLRAPLLERAVAAAPQLDRFEPWVRVDLHGYAQPPWPFQLRRMLAGLGNLDGQRPLFRVPLLVEDRDAVLAELLRRQVPVGYAYDPPLDDYAGPRFAEPSPVPEVARWWARRVLPVDPLDAGRVLGALGPLGVPRAAEPHHRQERSVPCSR
jgi:Acetyltransferase (GNAT) domain/DegT/DnrJ/EryC1/StrS aminotransferase family